MGVLAAVALVGRMLVLFALLMVVPMLFAVINHDAAEAHFLNATAVTFGMGLVMSLATRRFKRELQPRDGFVLVGLTWITLPLFGALPLWLAVPDFSVTDAFFEAMSAFTATGATVLDGLDQLPVSVNVWRCFMMLVGGLGIIVLAVAMVFMLLSGINLVLYFAAWRRRSWSSLLGNVEVQAFYVAVFGTIALISSYLFVSGTYPSYVEALRHTAFHVISIATTTGYATNDYAQWPIFAPLLMILLGCFATCAGSTGGGIKMVRLLLLLKQSRRELVRIVHPSVINPVTIGGGTVSERVMQSVIAFMMMYGATLVSLTMVLLFSGLDVVTAFTAVLACVNNIGPGLGEVGPSVNYQGLTDFQTWVCSLAMLLGRLELLSVLVLLTPQFWRR